MRNEIHSNLKETKLISESQTCFVSVVSLLPLENAMNVKENLFVLIPLYPILTFFVLCTYRFFSCSSSCSVHVTGSLTPARLFSQACVCWILAGFGLKGQLALICKQGTMETWEKVGYFLLFLSKLTILIEIIAKSIKQVYQMT